MKTQVETIDCTPTWMKTLNICLLTLDEPMSKQTLETMSKYCEALRLAAISEPELVNRILKQYMPK